MYYVYLQDASVIWDKDLCLVAAEVLSDCRKDEVGIMPQMRELHCKEECELLMQHAAITSPVIIGDDIIYSLFFYVMMPSPLICSKQRPVWIFTL